MTRSSRSPQMRVRVVTCGQRRVWCTWPSKVWRGNHGGYRATSSMGSSTQHRPVRKDAALYSTCSRGPGFPPHYKYTIDEGTLESVFVFYVITSCLRDNVLFFRTKDQIPSLFLSTFSIFPLLFVVNCGRVLIDRQLRRPC